MPASPPPPVHVVVRPPAATSIKVAPRRVTPARRVPPPVRRPATRPTPRPRGRRLGGLLHPATEAQAKRNLESLLIAATLGMATLIAFFPDGTGGAAEIAAEQAATRVADQVAPAAPTVPAAVDTTPTAAPAGTGCTEDDPTGDDGCLTPAAAHGYAEIQRVFGPVLRGAGCWDPHSWNPSSDHAKGKGCDIYTSPSGKFASGEGLDRGWELAEWLRANAAALEVRYVIWQGRIWSTSRPDDVGGGWGRPYSGGGVYDPNDPVGGHFDHIHVSFTR